MDKQEFYLNQSLNHECIKLPEKDKKYLLRNNFLSEYFSEQDKAQVRSNLGITSLLDELKSFILAKLFDEEGNITFDLEPHEDAFNKVLSSAVIYNILLKYYTKEELDEWREQLIDEFNQLKESSKVLIDNTLDKNSENPVLNKTIASVIEELNNAYSRLSNTKLDKEIILNYYNIDEINSKLNQLSNELKELINSIPKTDLKIDSELSEDSVNPLQNKVIKQLLDNKVDLSLLENYVTSELLSNLSDVIDAEKERAQNSESLLDSKINDNKTLINNILDLINHLIKHVLITQSAYDALETYEKDTLYLIIEQNGSKLGEDTFPLILG